MRKSYKYNSTNRRIRFDHHLFPERAVRQFAFPLGIGLMAGEPIYVLFPINFEYLVFILLPNRVCLEFRFARVRSIKIARLRLLYAIHPALVYAFIGEKSRVVPISRKALVMFFA